MPAPCRAAAYASPRRVGARLVRSHHRLHPGHPNHRRPPSRSHRAHPVGTATEPGTVRAWQPCRAHGRRSRGQHHDPRSATPARDGGVGPRPRGRRRAPPQVGGVRQPLRRGPRPGPRRAGAAPAEAGDVIIRRATPPTACTSCRGRPAPDRVRARGRRHRRAPRGGLRRGHRGDGAGQRRPPVRERRGAPRVSSALPPERGLPPRHPGASGGAPQYHRCPRAQATATAPGGSAPARCATSWSCRSTTNGPRTPSPGRSPRRSDGSSTATGSSPARTSTPRSVPTPHRSPACTGSSGSRPTSTPWCSSRRGTRPVGPRACIDRADVVLAVASAATRPDRRPIEDLLDRPGHPARTELVLVHDPATETPRNTRTWLRSRSVRRHHHVHAGNDADTARVARLVINRGLGVVFGGGGHAASPTSACCGRSKRHGVPIDATGGTSIGSILAGAVGTGHDADRTAALLRRGPRRGQVARRRDPARALDRIRRPGDRAHQGGRRRTRCRGRVAQRVLPCRRTSRPAASRSIATVRDGRRSAPARGARGVPSGAEHEGRGARRRRPARQPARGADAPDPPRHHHHRHRRRRGPGAARPRRRPPPAWYRAGPTRGRRCAHDTIATWRASRASSCA